MASLTNIATTSSFVRWANF